MQFSQIPFNFPQTIQQRQGAPGARPLQIEEFLELLLFLCVCTYFVCHMLFIPLEVLAVGFLLDIDFVPALAFFCAVLFGKYATLFMMLYGAFHHTALWKGHHYATLGFFGISCLLVSALLSYFVYSVDAGFRRIGFAPITEHPFLWDFVGYVICGVQGFIYFIYMSCTAPPAQEYAYAHYSAVPQMELMQSSSMMNEFQPILVQPQPPEEIIPQAVPQNVFVPKPKKPERVARKVPVYFLPQY